MSTSFTTVDTGTAAPDPSKHVNYTQGMVLGVDDFTQEFAYLDNRDQWLPRETIGYGTVTGLQVDAHLKDGQHEISVSPGVALSPRGQLIRVKPAQCAVIETWLQLDTTQAQLQELAIAANATFDAYVVLCYRDCPVDNLPVPGEPCRCDSDTLAPSRIQDDFRLELTLRAPPQREEDAVRDLVTWLRGIPVDDFTPSSGELETFLNALRDQFNNEVSPPDSSPPGSPPLTLRIPRDEVCPWMRAALRVWVTELRPLVQEQWAARGAGASCSCGDDETCHSSSSELPEDGRDCLLLARLSLTKASNNITDVVLDEETRPFLVHLRMLQELLLCGRGRGASAQGHSFGTAFTLDENTVRLWSHHPESLTIPAGAVSLWLDGVEITDFALSSSQTNIYDLSLPDSPPGLLAPGATIEIRLDAESITDSSSHPLSLLLHTAAYHYNDYEEPTLKVFGFSDTVPEIVLPVPNDPALVAENTFITTARPANPGRSLDFARADHTHGLPPDPIPPHKADPNAHFLFEDVTGPLSATFIANLQRIPVKAEDPKDKDVLQYDKAENAWIPTQIEASAPTDPNVVTRPPKETSYSIVAAGIVNVSTGDVRNPYNKLRYSVIPNPNGAPKAGVLTYGTKVGTSDPLAGYTTQEDWAEFPHYIVKATSFGEKGTAGLLHVRGFSKDGILIDVIPIKETAAESYMIEISAYGRPTKIT